MAMTTPIVDRLDTSKIQYVDVDGIRTRYYEDGAGEPLVLFHGGQYASYYATLDCWSLNLPGLAEHFHVYAFDKLGQGFTDNPKDDSGFEADALVAHTIGTLQALGLHGAHLVGHSRGGWLIAYLALTNPGLATTLVVVDSNTLAPDDPLRPEIAMDEFYKEIARRVPPGPPSLEGVRLEPEAQTYNRERVTDDFLNRVLEIARLPKSQEAAKRYKEVGDAIWIPSLMRKKQETLRMIDGRGLPAPTLVVWGQNDPSAPVSLAHTLFHRIAAKTPKCELHVFNHAGHYSFREHPERFNQVVRDFCVSVGS